jgi:hypothetical protein
MQVFWFVSGNILKVGYLLLVEQGGAVNDRECQPGTEAAGLQRCKR